MLIIPKDQLYQYKLHKVVLGEYNKYIDETCEVVENISNKLSADYKNYSFTKNNERRSRNLFPSFKNKLNEILLNYASEFGFKEYHQHQEVEDHCYHYYQYWEKEDHHYHHQEGKDRYCYQHHQEKNNSHYQEKEDYYQKNKKFLKKNKIYA